MWIQENKAGHFQFFERYKTPEGKSKVISVTYPKKTPKYQRLATDVLRERLKELTAPRSASVTLQEAADEYIKWKYATQKEQTAKGSAGKMRVLVDLIGGDIPLKDLTPAIYAERTDAPAGTYNERLTRFRAFLRWAYKRDLLEDPRIIDKLERKKDVPHRVKIQDKFLEREELRALIAGLEPLYALAVEFLTLTGLRVSEMTDLRRDHVDIAAREISVDSTYAILTKKSSSTKTEASERVIYIQDELMDCVKRIQAFTDGIKSEFFICAENGDRVSYNGFRMYLSRHAPALIGRKISPHIFRHTHVSLLAEAGIPLEQIARRLGHNDSRVTREIYLHITRRMILRENERLDRIKLL